MFAQSLMNTFEEWGRLWQAVGGRGDARPCYERLAQAYSEPHRYYHNFRHVTECLDVFDSARHLAGHPEVVEMAIWFHDAVYDTRSSDNEERSAVLAKQCLLEAGVGDDFVDTVSRLILATKSHDATTEDDAPVMVDVDLSIFGQSEARFDEYEAQIRQEYSWVPRTIFVARRTEILERFLSREHIYTTHFFDQKFEQLARRNIQGSLRRLRSMV